MSVSSELSECGKLAGKTSFSHTCSLLSQYLKEKGNFGDLSLGMARSVELNGLPETKFRSVAATMNLFPVTEKPEQFSGSSNLTAPRNTMSMDLFPREEDLSKISNSSANKAAPKEPEAAQMTIFYAGQVFVFNDFPADKAKEVMLLASKASSLPAPVKPQTIPAAASMVQTPAISSTAIPQSPIVERSQRPAEPIASDLPIARRASLHRFLEKRKDRLTAKAPYLMGGSPAPPLKPAADNQPWLGLSAQSAQ